LQPTDPQKWRKNGAGWAFHNEVAISFLGGLQLKRDKSNMKNKQFQNIHKKIHSTSKQLLRFFVQIKESCFSAFQKIGVQTLVWQNQAKALTPTKIFI
jgi:hypothetical protein